jgi:hypothetical protein
MPTHRSSPSLRRRTHSLDRHSTSANRMRATRAPPSATPGDRMTHRPHRYLWQTTNRLVTNVGRRADGTAGHAAPPAGAAALVRRPRMGAGRTRRGACPSTVWSSPTAPTGSCWGYCPRTMSATCSTTGSARTDAEPEAVVRIVAGCARLPLALSVAAAYAGAAPRAGHHRARRGEVVLRRPPSRCLLRAGWPAGCPSERLGIAHDRQSKEFQRIANTPCRIMQEPAGGRGIRRDRICVRRRGWDAAEAVVG